MQRFTLPLTAVVLLTWTSAHVRAQEPIPAPQPTPEKVAPPQEKVPPVVEAPLQAPCAPTCPGVRVLWLERAAPVPVLTPREVPIVEKRPALVVDFRIEKRKVCETLIESREVSREVPFTTLKPVVETCPTTGECHTVMQPCTEMRVVKETVFYAVPKERVIEIRVPYVKEVVEEVARKAIVMEYINELQPCPAALAVPTQEPRDQWLLTPQPCPHH